MTYQRADLGSMYLPVGNMLQIDRVVLVDERRIVCEMDVLPAHWVFDLHFPGDPIFPGCLQVEAAGQVVAIWAWHNGVRGSPRLAKASAEFELPIRPQPEPVVFTGTIRLRRHICLGSVELTVGGRLAATVELALVIVPEGVNGGDGSGGGPPP